jgi:hypothetical protein
MEKMVALAAMPKPMETTAAAAKPGDLDSRRSAYMSGSSVKGKTAVLLDY